MSMDPGDRAVGEHVGGVGEELGARDQRDPSRMNVIEGPADLVHAGDFGQRQDRDRGEPGGYRRQHDWSDAQSDPHPPDDTGRRKAQLGFGRA